MPKLTRKKTFSLADFQRDSEEIIQQLEETGKPVTLTVDGKKKLVVLDADAYVRLMKHVERLETIEAIAQGLKEMKEGRGIPLAQVEAEMRRKYGI